MIPSTPAVPVLAAAALFVGLSVVIGALLASSGGWRAAAEDYPPPTEPPPDTQWFRFVSMRTVGGILGGVSYRSCVNVGLSKAGISLAIWAPFRLGHSPLFIPWHALTSCADEPLPWGHSVRVTLRGGNGFRFYGRAGQAISSRWRDMGFEVQQPWRS